MFGFINLLDNNDNKTYNETKSSSFFNSTEEGNVNYSNYFIAGKNFKLGFIGRIDRISKASNETKSTYPF